MGSSASNGAVWPYMAVHPAVSGKLSPLSSAHPGLEDMSSASLNGDARHQGTDGDGDAQAAPC